MSDIEVTAQTRYKELVQGRIVPALRKLGFKGSRGNYDKQLDDWRLGITFTKSMHSTRNLVSFFVQVSLQHLPTVESFDEANERAAAAGRVREIPPAGQVWAQLAQLTGDGPVAWDLDTSSPLEPIAREIFDLIENSLPKAVNEEMARPLVPPTPLEKRPMRRGTE